MSQAQRFRRRTVERETRRQVLEEKEVDRAEIMARENALLFVQTKVRCCG